jgi:DNA repair protein RecO (recombination protein O)
MLVKTKAIVLTSLKYGESDLIVKCFTEEGVKSYLLKRILKSNSKKINVAYFQPLTQLKITANHNSNGNLNSIREARINHLYQTIPFNVFKQSIVLFLAETLAYSLYEEEKNPVLYQYIETALVWLDTHERTSNFHVLFLLNLTKYLGFYPEMENLNYAYFDLREGVFTHRKPLNDSVFGEKLNLFKSLIGINFDVIGQLGFNSRSRNIMLDILLDYYELHLPAFKKPKSLNVLKEVFR